MAITLMTPTQTKMAEDLFRKEGSNVLANPTFVDLAKRVGATDVHELYAKVNGWAYPTKVERPITPTDSFEPVVASGVPAAIASYYHAVGDGSEERPMAVVLGSNESEPPTSHQDEPSMRDWVDTYLAGQSVRRTNFQDRFAVDALRSLESWSTPFQNQMKNLREMVRISPGSEQTIRFAQDIGAQMRMLLDEDERGDYLWLDTQILGYANDTKDQIRPGYDVNKNNLG